MKKIITILTVALAAGVHGIACSIVSDDFSVGSGVLGVINGWEGVGNETKEYNVAASGVLQWSHTSGTAFDSVALAFEPEGLANLNDSITVSFDYQILGTTNNSTSGLRARLYKRGVGLFTSDAHGYGLNIPTGTGTGRITYQDIVNTAAFGTGANSSNASASLVFGGAGSVVLTVTKTGANAVTLSGFSSVSGAFTPGVRSVTLTNFDSVGFSVGSLTHGLRLDNVLVSFNPGIPNTPPSFSNSLISASAATLYVPYSGSIAGAASDTNGDLLTFSKLSGPAWLNVMADGTLAGAPSGANLGTNVFTVQVDDGNCGSSTATLEIPVLSAGSSILFSDTFDSGSGLRAGSGSIANGWESGGPEEKVYNTTSSLGTNFVGKLGWSSTEASLFESVAVGIPGYSLSAVGDFISVSFDYQTRGTLDQSAGLRVRLYERGADLFSAGASGYGLNIPSGASTVALGYRSLINIAPFNSGASAGDAINSANSYGDGGSVVFKVIRTGAGEITLSGSHGTNLFLNQVAATNRFTFDSFGVSVGTVAHGLQIDNVRVAVGGGGGTLWNQYVEAKSSGSTPTLPDFSYAGYHHGEQPIPTVDWPVFNVTNYGAVADDGLSDKAAIEAAVAAAAVNGSGIVFFPPGRFDINKPVVTWVNDPIYVQAGRIVFRGSGRGPGGTELFAERHMDPTNPLNLWTCPYMIYFKGYGDRPGTASAVVADSQRETHAVTVANAAIFQPGDWVQLHRLDNSTQAVAEAVAPYPVEPGWTSLINDGVAVDEHHLIQSISGNVLTFKEPIHSVVESNGNWSVVLFDPIEEVGVEDIAFTGNWTSNFVHHASFYDDSGWSALQFANTVNSWIRRCRFTDWSAAVSVASSAAVSVTDLKIDGNPGHNTLTFNGSSHCFAGMIDDTANHWHSCGIAGTASGNVFWRSEYSSNSCYESHAAQPRHTLFDNIAGGWKYGRWGGAIGNQPNHLENLVLWNYRNTGAGEPGLFQFMRWSSDYGRTIMPYVIGFHGNPQAWDESMIAALESNGTAVEPESLYDAQYRMRLGNPVAHLFYEEWAAGYELSGSEAAFGADPDLDFRRNLHEYAVGGIPTAGTNSLSELPDYGLVGSGESRALQYVYSRRRAAAALGLVYAVEQAGSLTDSSWSTGGVVEVGTAAINDDFESVTNQVPVAPITSGFVRLKVDIVR